MRILTAICFILCLAGCVVPRVEKFVASPRVRGRVLDATTLNPVERARVAIVGRSKHAFTDSLGFFDLHVDYDRTFFDFGIGDSRAYPRPKEYSEALEIVHPGYEPFRVKAGDIAKGSRDMEWVFTRDILLVSRSK